MLGRQNAIVRAALLVAFAAVLEAALTPFLTFGWVGPRFTVLGVVIAVTGLRGLQPLLLGFFGGVLVDALGVGSFGVGALAGVLAAVISGRFGATRRKGEGHLVPAAVVSVAVYDLLCFVSIDLSGGGGPPIIRYVLGGLVPDVLLNALLLYFVGGKLLKLVATKGERWA